MKMTSCVHKSCALIYYFIEILLFFRYGKQLRGKRTSGAVYTVGYAVKSDVPEPALIEPTLARRLDRGSIATKEKSTRKGCCFLWRRFSPHGSVTVRLCGSTGSAFTPEPALIEPALTRRFD